MSLFAQHASGLVDTVGLAITCFCLVASGSWWMAILHMRLKRIEEKIGSDLTRLDKRVDRLETAALEARKPSQPLTVK